MASEAGSENGLADVGDDALGDPPMLRSTKINVLRRGVVLERNRACSERVAGGQNGVDSRDEHVFKCRCYLQVTP